MVVAIVYPSAAEFWLNAAKKINFDVFSVKKRKLVNLPDDLGKRAGMKEIRMVADGCSLRMPLHIMASSVKHRNSCAGCIYHARPKVIPKDSFIFLGKISAGDVIPRAVKEKSLKADYTCDNQNYKNIPQISCEKNMEDIYVYVASPEYTFLLAAGRFGIESKKTSIPGLPSNIINLAVLGTELCSMYVHDSAAKYKHRRISPVATAKTLREYLAASLGTYGINNARKAAKYILDNSNSPMETKISLYITMPPSAGGFGIPKPELNGDIHLKNFGTIICDLVWRTARTISEYDSDETHMDKKQHSVDSERQNALTEDGWHVVRVTADIMKETNKREKALMSIRRYLRLGNKYRLEKYEERRPILWKYLSQTPVYDMFFRE